MRLFAMQVQTDEHIFSLALSKKMVESHTFPRVIELGGVINYSNNSCKIGQFVILEINCNIDYI